MTCVQGLRFVWDGLFVGGRGRGTVCTGGSKLSRVRTDTAVVVVQAAVNMQGVVPPSRRGKYRSDRYMVKYRNEDEPRVVYVKSRSGMSQLASLKAELKAAKSHPGELGGG